MREQRCQHRARIFCAQVTFFKRGSCRRKSARSWSLPALCHFSQTPRSSGCVSCASLEIAKKPYLLEAADFPPPAGPAAAGPAGSSGDVSCASLEHSINTACKASRWSSPLHHGVNGICLSYRGRNARFQVVLACFPGIRRGKVDTRPGCTLVIAHVFLSGSVGEGGMRNGREPACERQKGRPRPPGAGRAIPGWIPAGE